METLEKRSQIMSWGNVIDKCCGEMLHCSVVELVCMRRGQCGTILGSCLRSTGVK